MRHNIRFLWSGQVIELKDVGPTETLLDYIRLRARQTGTKEGCGEGDCGACTVALGRLRNGQLVYEPVNSCILLLAQIDGCELVTIEDLSRDGTLHPIQKAFVDVHASQCGFCTPGFIMNLFTLYHRDTPGLDHQDVATWLAGNLCRCTGYRPIVEAALETCRDAANDAFSARASKTIAALEDLNDGDDIFIRSKDTGFTVSPSTIASLCAVYLQHPDATLVSGATDVGLWITKHMKELPKVILLNRIADMQEIKESPIGTHIGAGVTFAQAATVLAKQDPDLGEVLRRLGSVQVRASGTIGGNIANGSPIGDSPPLLIALGARITLRLGRVERELPLEDFFIDYGKQDIAESEVLTGIFVPRLDANQVFRAYKVSKRFDQDISAVMAAFRFSLVKDRVVDARIAYGGMAGTPKRAAHCETALIGASISNEASWQSAVTALESDFTPLTDMRASNTYRMDVAKALLTKALLEVGGSTTTQTRVTGHREREVRDVA
ncbi:xanthine dehydrogenase small subunit [Pseudovibrio sp. SPO723]|uniref:xanthine dehydrogenase small subunit n=1 Tax=Nesiotobacter zosterae TaxID=392721 RepID=UPI0029C1398F|nr:xanthine dehydrogenase small subunit [Pseudovibrio sp. SPO723]MDX5593884.1 xanthine dehydrogenase small subunit [Pseudovibrio sp. SPO723]